MPEHWHEMAHAIRLGLVRRYGRTTAEDLHEVLYDRPPSQEVDHITDLNRTLDGVANKPVDKLARIARQLGLPLAELLMLRELGMARQKLNRAEPDGDDATTYGWVVDQLEAQLQSMESQRPVPDPRSVTLRDWGTERLDVRRVVVGDRRHSVPSSTADILASGASPRDLQDVFRLGLPPDTRIYVDRLPLLAPDVQRRDMVGHDVLAIGSGKVNILTMLCQGSSTFELTLPDTLGEDVAELITALRYEFDPDRLRRYAGRSLKAGEDVPVPPSDVARLCPVPEVVAAFGERNFRDILAEDGQHTYRRQSRQHMGTIALARHPWAEDRVVVLVYGTSIEATYAGIVGLASLAGSHPDGSPGGIDELKAECVQRPLGGVYYVESNADRPPYLWSSGVRPRWLTEPYTVDEYRARVGTSALSSAQQIQLLDLLDLLERRA